MQRPEVRPGQQAHLLLQRQRGNSGGQLALVDRGRLNGRLTHRRFVSLQQEGEQLRSAIVNTGAGASMGQSRVVRETNWAGNYTYRATRLHRPSTLDQVREVVAGAPRLRVIGSRHSFSDIGDSSELLSLDRLPARIAVDHAGRTVTVAAGLTYAELAIALRRHGVALHNLASLPHISVGGAIATASHGSGDRSRNLAGAVAGLEIVTSSGEIVTASRGDEDFDGIVVGLGALGVLTRVTLDVEPAYDVRQRVFEDMSWDALFDDFGAISGSADSVSVFTRWQDRIDQVWLKSRVSDEPEDLRTTFFGARAATVERHPILGIDPVNCTPQLGAAGVWSDRLPHFRMGFTPSAGAEIQSEFFVARSQAAAAIRSTLAVADVIRPVLQVSEIRTIAADELWMSPQYGRDTVSLHFTWNPDPPAVERALIAVEAALAPFAARPHWGKVFLADAARVGPLYERLPDFLRLRRRLDPRGAFRNDWLERRVIGATTT
jgi:xylitol oxidase